MRWSRKLWRVGSLRDRSGFLWFPRTMWANGVKEVRWLERAAWREEMVAGKNGPYWRIVWWTEMEADDE